MRYLLFLALVLASCARPSGFTSLPALSTAALRSDSSQPAPVVLVLPANNKKGQITLQLGTGNQAAATGTDNTGRDASDGANGGQSAAVRSGPPWWVYLLVAGLGAGFGVWALRKWQAWRARPG